ncbi:PP0621 family protein [Ramlibacter tataouinensis]|uniref:Preprotein translocase subunit YajC n=1 Tax=Ramlibacter tataouinensis (strain ATCC BAA-407 / DSM 14655 / LMG 21543 / TTB310) TaxID=365046 RepID=F5Y013_RAMTT|nr:PP0621 family protein [Ramlibacter tataouinensis]AEG94562.1 hypothetical protein Rta_34490 [Ramlibacter tataouinensis TTB310]
MKYLVLLGILLVVYLLWRAQRGREAREAPPQAPAPTAASGLPQDMVRCPVCALHLPKSDAVPGQHGRLYCSADHRLLGDR